MGSPIDLSLTSSVFLLFGCLGLKSLAVEAIPDSCFNEELTGVYVLKTLVTAPSVVTALEAKELQKVLRLKVIDGLTRQVF